MVKRARSSSSLSSLSATPEPALAPSPSKPPADPSPQKAKKLKLLAEYASASPFPDYAAPSADTCRGVHAVLSRAHPHKAHERKLPAEKGGNSAQSCGGVADVLDALLGTVLSQNTSGRNSTAAKRNLDAAFGTGERGMARLAAAPREQVVDALRTGGMANKKAAVIQKLLGEVKERHGRYSLQHLAAPGLPDDEIMNELVSFDGVGPKTASCVLLFSLGRDSFAVDTHVYRLARLLRWVPARADRVQAQAHLERRVPPTLKYALHVLMVAHGRACAGCKAPGARGDCVLKAWLKEQGVQAEDVEERVEDAQRDVEDTKAVKVELQASPVPTTPRKRTSRSRK